MARVRSLDVFRGLTIFLMILVNSPGLSVAYSPLVHAIGNGCTLADWVFPFFLVILGASSVLTQPTLKSIVKRTLIMLGLGLILNAFPNHWEWSSLRLPGVLQRIAICYLFSALMHRYTRWQVQVVWMFCLLILHACIVGFFGIESIGIVDKKIFSSHHLYQHNFDPEGLLTTIPALASTLCGHILGMVFQQNLSKVDKRSQILFLGMVFCILGWIWQYFWPLNKSIWTSSYALWTAGLAFLAWFCCDVWCRWLYPFEVLGKHALFIYVLHVLVLKLQMSIQVPVDGNIYSLKTYMTYLFFGGFSNLNASLAYAITCCLFWLMVAFGLQKFHGKGG